MSTGCLIVCDGGNGAGKTTVLKAIEAHVRAQGHDPIMTREPGGTPIGEKIRDLLLHHGETPMCDVTELMLFAAARAQHVREKIMPALQAGNIVISDRFDSASISFQHYGRGMPRDVIEQLNVIALAGVRATITIILDLDPATGLERVSSRGEGLDRMENAELSFLRKARHGYLAQAAAEPDRFVVIDASQPLERVIAEAIAVVDAVVANRRLKA